MPGRFKDFIAMPKFNGYRALHTTVIGPQGRPLEIQVRTREMHETAEYGVAAHWIYKGGRRERHDEEWTQWVKQLMDVGTNEADPHEFMKTFRTDLFDEEVHVFTPKGQVKTLPAGSTPIDFAYAVHTDVGHRTVGAKVNGRIVPLHYRLQNGDFVEILTSKQERGPSRDWMSLAKSSRARNKIRQWFTRETREDQEQKGRESLEHALKQQNLPVREAARTRPCSPQVIRDLGLQEGRGLLPRARLGPAAAGRDRQQGDPAAEDRRGRRGGAGRHEDAEGAERRLGLRGRRRRRRASRTCSCGSRSAARRCRATRSSATSRSARGSRSTASDCPNVKALRRTEERFTPVEWSGDGDEVVPRADRRHLVGPPAAARGRRADVRRARREHRLLRRRRRGSAREELVHGRGRRRRSRSARS